MYHRFAQNITSHLIKKTIIKKTDEDIYVYGFEMLLSQMVYISIMIIIAVLANAFIETIAFFIGFYLYRKVAGGYHANTYIKCHLLFAATQALFLIALHSFPTYYRFTFIACVLLICIIITFMFAPIDHPNKPFDYKEYLKYKKQSRLFCVLFFVFIVMFFFLEKNNVFLFSSAFGVLSANISLLYAFIERRLKHEKV